MKYIEYKDPRAFLDRTQSVLEEQEALYGLMLGICLRLVEHPLHYGDPPFLATMEDGGELALLALMTPPHKLQVVAPAEAFDVPVRILATRLLEGGWPVPGVLAREDVAVSFERAWSALARVRGKHGMRQRIYALRAVEDLDLAPGTCRQATPADLDVAAAWRDHFSLACFGKRDDAEESRNHARTVIDAGDLYFWIDPEPVSMACYTRATAHGTAIGLVYTPEACRRRGYAGALVASLCRQALARGKTFCTLYSDLANPTSNHIYQRIGFRPVADVMDIMFLEEAEGVRDRAS